MALSTFGAHLASARQEERRTMNMADLLAKTKTDLLKIAQRHGLRGVSTLKKEELADKIHQAQQRFKGATSKQPLGASTVARTIADAVKRRAVRKQATE